MKWEGGRADMEAFGGRQGRHLTYRGRQAEKAELDHQMLQQESEETVLEMKAGREPGWAE